MVAPLAGAWIETGNKTFPASICAKVAPLAGAWFETISFNKGLGILLTSLPSRERGLKPIEADKDKLTRRRSPRGSVD